MSSEAEKGHHKSQDAEYFRALAWPSHRHSRQAERDTSLHQQHPPASASQPGRDQAIHQGGPQEFQRVRETDKSKNADGFQIEPDDRQPGLQRPGSEGQWQPRCKAQGQHDGNPPVRKNLYERWCFHQALSVGMKE